MPFSRLLLLPGFLRLVYLRRFSEHWWHQPKPSSYWNHLHHFISWPLLNRSLLIPHVFSLSGEPSSSYDLFSYGNESANVNVYVSAESSKPQQSLTTYVQA
jgi:hypothetical protein